MQRNAPDADLSIRHLEAELAKIDLIIQREVRKWRAAGQDPSDDFRGLYLSQVQAEALVARPFGANWGQVAPLDPAEAETFAKAIACAGEYAQAVAEAAREAGCITRLAHLAAAFGLTVFELDAFLVCLAPALDLRYERLYGYLQDDVTRHWPSVSLVLDLLCSSPEERLARLAHFSLDAPLLRQRLLRSATPTELHSASLLGQALAVEPTVVAWLLGNYQAGPENRACVQVVEPQASDEDRLLAARAWADLEPALGRADAPIVVLHGPDELAQRAAARLVAQRLQQPLLVVDLAMSAAGEYPLREVVTLALRDAVLLGAVPFFIGWDVVLNDGVPQPEVLAEVSGYSHLALVGGESVWRAQNATRDRALVWIELGAPHYAERRALWQHFLGRVSPQGAPDVEELAGQFTLTAGEIRDAVAIARDAAAQRSDPLQLTDLFAAARARSNPRLAHLARKITPRYSWADIILPADQLAILRELVAAVRGRPTVLEGWGVGRKLAASDGLTALFAGPPGTGKTMAAEIIAGELKLDLYKIDLSTVVSKYIGETEKNLERIFSEAQSSNAILFFDEADAIFGKRSEVKDAHDRYANIEISYLLQRMEAYDGVTILATNLRANLDEAFTRRLQFAIDFPFPEEEDRIRIWEALFPPTVPRAPDIDLAFLAQRFKLAGGSIRNIIVNAAFLAAADNKSVTMQHLLHATRRELQKLGRLVNEADIDLI
ncbi:MAG: ATP-binding protein [Anaerolineales bacterium]|nr:ATP-binding protein [Anaerolineales bacterium]